MYECNACDAYPHAKPASCMIVLRLRFAWQAIWFHEVSMGPTEMVPKMSAEVNCVKCKVE